MFIGMRNRETNLGRRRLKTGLVLWAVTSVIGVGVVAIPDEGPPMFSLSDGHGPSAVDMLGVALILIGWTAFVRGLWSMRSIVEHRLLWGVIAVAGVVLVVWSVGTDTGSWWVLGAGVLVAVQVAVAVSALAASSLHTAVDPG